MATIKPKLQHQVFEARYERGYRYLDKTGDVMLVLEELLQAATEKVWMPAEMAPKGAIMKCPELDAVVQFDAWKMILIQQPVSFDFNFAEIAEIALATITGRFDLHDFLRFGHRRMSMIGTNSAEEADALAVKLIPVADWPRSDKGEFQATDTEIASTFETEDRSRGFRFAVKSVIAPTAPEAPDPRLQLPSHLLPKGQKEALLTQIKLRQQRESDPLAGVLLDLDYYAARPKKLRIADFIKESVACEDKVFADVLKRGSP